MKSTHHIGKMTTEAIEMFKLKEMFKLNGIVTELYDIKCQYCDFHSTTTKKVRDHTLDMHYQTSPWPCPLCYYPPNAKNLGHKSKRDLRAHISKIHTLPAAILAQVSARIKLHRQISVEAENTFNIRYGGHPPIAYTIGTGSHTHAAAPQDSSICRALAIDNVAHATKREFFDHLQQAWVEAGQPWAKEKAEKLEIFCTLCTPDTCFCRHVPRCHHHGEGLRHCTKCPAVIYR